MLPFDINKYTKEKNASKSTKCSQQALANKLVSDSYPQQTGAPPIQQAPAKQ